MTQSQQDFPRPKPRSLFSNNENDKSDEDFDRHTPSLDPRLRTVKDDCDDCDWFEEIRTISIADDD